jgi:cyclin-dependent kinase 8/11
MRHENVIVLREVMLEDKSIFMVFEYAEHDFLVCFEFVFVCHRRV